MPCSCKYAEHYLAGFAYRFNRRFDLRGLVASLIVDVVRAKPIKEKGPSSFRVETNGDNRWWS